MPGISFLTTPYAWLSRLLAPCDDYWTWMTNDGTIYEEVDVIKIGMEMVTFRHRHGTASVALTELPSEVQRSLRENIDVVEPRESRAHTSMLVHSMSKAG
jgi:hypothetical protein